jgi:hypothetical protein
LGTSTNLWYKDKHLTFDMSTTLQAISRWWDQEAQGAHLCVRQLIGRRLHYLCPCHLLDLCLYLFHIVNHLPLDDMQYQLLKCICSSHVKRTHLDSSASRFPVKRRHVPGLRGPIQQKIGHFCHFGGGTWNSYSSLKFRPSYCSLVWVYSQQCREYTHAI